MIPANKPVQPIKAKPEPRYDSGARGVPFFGGLMLYFPYLFYY